MDSKDRKYISELRTVLDTNIDYYEYMLMRYFNDTSIDLRGSWDTQWRNIGFDIPSDSDLLRSAYMNIIKSVIDSLVSKLSNQKVRPYFNAINGDWNTKRTVKNVQQYFDILFDNQKINKKVATAFKLACIMGKGYIFVNPVTYEIMPLPAHCVATLQCEERYGQAEHAIIRFLNFPTAKLSDYGVDYSGNNFKCNLQLYISVPEKKLCIIVNSSVVKEYKYDHDTLPLVSLFFTSPVFGTNTTSIVQELDGIQTQVDFINSQISAATQISPVNQTFVVEGSNLNPKDLTNKAGTVYGIKMPPGVSVPPVVSVAPRMFDPQWQSLLDYYKKTAYEIIGISELSSMSKKPSGLDSGVALQTMEDIESDRFETQVDHYINAFVDLAKLLIEVLPDNEDILPESLNTSSLKWKDIKKQSDLFKVQYSAASSLSKDPAEKIKQIMQLTQIGLISPDKVARYLDMPDLEDAYHNASAVADGVSQCITRAIDEGDYSVPDWVSYENLAQEITVIQNELYSSLTDDEKNNEKVLEAIKRLTMLEDNLATKMEENGYIQTQQPEEAVESESGIGIAPSAVEAGDITSTIEENPVEPNDAMVNEPLEESGAEEA